ncbi:hypothetical protein [Actinomadura geliboluensis]|nr:hypothetical protein [Actinomadura geliboluensis]
MPVGPGLALPPLHTAACAGNGPAVGDGPISEHVPQDKRLQH